MFELKARDYYGNVSVMGTEYTRENAILSLKVEQLRDNSLYYYIEEIEEIE